MADLPNFKHTDSALSILPKVLSCARQVELLFFATQDPEAVTGIGSFGTSFGASFGSFGDAGDDGTEQEVADLGGIALGNGCLLRERGRRARRGRWMRAEDERGRRGRGMVCSGL